MKVMDPMLNKTVRELYAIRDDVDALDADSRVRKHASKSTSYACLEHSEAEKKGMILAQADQDGDFIIDDPITAYLVVQSLERGLTINKPNSIMKEPVKYELGKFSAPIPTEQEFNKLMKERLEKEKK